MKLKFNYALVFSACMPLISGCTTTTDSNSQMFSGVLSDAYASDSFETKLQTESNSLKSEAIAALKEKKLEDASKKFNLALKLQPSDGELHFLNAFTYQLRADQGNDALYPLAETGYQIALRFDPNNWLASYLYGRVKFSQQDFNAAQELFAEAALYQPKNPNVLRDLAVASYYAKDLTLSGAIFTKLADGLEPTPSNIGSAAIVNAALGKNDVSDKYVDELWLMQKASKQPLSTSALKINDRVNEWRNFFAYLEKHPELLQENPTTINSGLASEADLAQSNEDMLSVDVVILRSEDDQSLSSGVNLLDGLQIQFGLDSNSTSGLSWERVTTSTKGSATTTLTKGIYIPAITYSLNIANASLDRAEVLANPTVVATFGKESTFFSGVEVDVTAVGGGGDGEVFNKVKQVGVSLKMTPEKRDDGKLKISVDASRTFLTTPNVQSVTYSYRIDTSKTSLNANVVMDYDQTLILAGLDSKQDVLVNSKVPWLGDVPVVGKLFSNDTDSTYQKSVLILLTPKRPEYQQRSAQTRVGEINKKSVEQFRRRYVSDEVIHNAIHWTDLSDDLLRREFRRSDLRLSSFELGDVVSQ